MQTSMWDGTTKYKIDKPTRLIELFAGIGSQAKAMSVLERFFGVQWESHLVVEYNQNAINSYNAVYCASKPQESTLDITKISATDLDIQDTDKYTYMMTYSFPCTDLSIAGNMQGMAKGSNTRSGLLWQVERLLSELSSNVEQLPKVLVMENVPPVVKAEGWADWVAFLDKLGYKSKWQILNAKDYGIPQSRERCFMVSILGDYYYNFPEPKNLHLRLQDMLQDKVMDKYYLSDESIEKMAATSYVSGNIACRLQDKDWCDTLLARDCKDPKVIVVGNLTDGKWSRVIEQSRRVFGTDGLAPTFTAHISVASSAIDNGGRALAAQQSIVCRQEEAKLGGGNQEIKVQELSGKVRKLTEREYWRLMGFEDIDFDKASAVNRKTALYSQAGNSIVVIVLIAIFGQLVGVDTSGIEHDIDKYEYILRGHMTKSEKYLLEDKLCEWNRFKLFDIQWCKIILEVEHYISNDLGSLTLYKLHYENNIAQKKLLDIAAMLGYSERTVFRYKALWLEYLYKLAKPLGLLSEANIVTAKMIKKLSKKYNKRKQ